MFCKASGEYGIGCKRADYRKMGTLFEGMEYPFLNAEVTTRCPIYGSIDDLPENMTFNFPLGKYFEITVFDPQIHHIFTLGLKIL